MRLIRFADCRTMPWKNGGGETTEIVVSPAGAGLDAFDWRVSMARVASDGPFSSFPGIDRTLAILDGEGLDLTIADARPVRLTGESPPLAFPADTPTSAALVGGPVTDLNVMSRRARVRHRVEDRRLAAGETLALRGPALVVAREPAALADGTLLEARDALLIEAGERWSGSAARPAGVVLITFEEEDRR